MFTVYASVNSTYTQHPPPPLGDPQALAFFLPWMANALSCVNTATFFIDRTVE